MTKDELAAIKARSDADYAKGVWSEWTQAEIDRARLLEHIEAASEPKADPPSKYCQRCGHALTAHAHGVCPVQDPAPLF